MLHVRRPHEVLLIGLVLAGCGGKASAPRAPTAPAEPQTAKPAVPSDCHARVVHSDGPCFGSVEEACNALVCAAGERCSIGYSLPPVVACARD